MAHVVPSRLAHGSAWILEFQNPWPSDFMQIGCGNDSVRSNLMAGIPSIQATSK